MASPASALAQPPPRKSPAVYVSRRNPHCWSNLPRDLMQTVFERLGFTDFERAKSVCSSWESGSRESQPNNQIPWMIIFPRDKNYCLLFNPEDKEKLYKTQPLGDDLADRNCVATCRSWLLMEPPYGGKERCFYILDLLTRERINLPGVVIESERLIYFLPVRRLLTPILWIDEKTKDYIVIGLVGEEALVCFKKGDDSWKQIPQLSLSCIYKCFRMVYKDHKLYCLNYDNLHIFDFSGDIPLQVSRISVHGYVVL